VLPIAAGKKVAIGAKDAFMLSFYF